MKIAITGAAGVIGTVLAAVLADEGHELCLIDLCAPRQPPPGTEVLRLDVRDSEALCHATAGVRAVIHLAAISYETVLSELVEHNIVGTYNVFEAARRNGVPRVVFASTHHVIGMYPVGEMLGTSAPFAPDSLYATSKIVGEALGALYAAKHEVEVVAIRIGSFEPRPAEARHAATWLSHRDGTALFIAAATNPLPQPFLVVYGISNNRDRWWAPNGWDAIGYEPKDDAAKSGAGRPPDNGCQGGSFAT
jgi:uronate dehydrogenase